MKLAEIQKREALHFLPVVNRMPVALVLGRGSRVTDVEGREYIDLTSGWGVCSIGHCHPTLVEAIREQAGRLMQTTNLYYTLPQLDAAEALVALSPPELTRAFFVNSGTEAVEGALKLAHRATGRSKFVSTAQSFHGRTLGALSIIGQAKHRDPYRDLLPEPVVVPFGDADAAVAAIDPQTAAMIVEPVQGEGGVNVAPEGYLARLRARCSEVGALLILDEVQTGIGRTGKMLALEHDGVVPDVLTLGKGVGGGFPVAAFLCSEGVAETVSPGDHGGTYIGNPLATTAVRAVLQVIAEEKLVQRAAEVGEELGSRLRAYAQAHPDKASGERGRGLLRGLVLRDAEAAAALPKRALAEGVLVNVTAGNVMRFFPALNIPEGELFGALDTLLGLVDG
ncbi:MAG: aspartate aminotransferase family protein [Deltaproteobacteria bacterium]|jgi:predicted acetylornithine/succinylornithine family transaminase|nr:aspartate aminotransferase family protein [Deltaproteobacteria bacterium]